MKNENEIEDIFAPAPKKKPAKKAVAPKAKPSKNEEVAEEKKTVGGYDPYIAEKLKNKLIRMNLDYVKPLQDIAYEKGIPKGSLNILLDEILTDYLKKHKKI